MLAQEAVRFAMFYAHALREKLEYPSPMYRAIMHVATL